MLWLPCNPADSNDGITLRTFAIGVGEGFATRPNYLLSRIEPIAAQRVR
jgi:hypothetical protein